MNICKKIVILIVALLSISVCVLIVAYECGLFYEPSEQQKRFMTEINAANAKIWYYGNLDPGKEITINYEKVTEFTEDTIGDDDNQYVYHAIVIFDFDGTMDISDEELMLIKDYCENNYYDMLYYGTAHLEQFKKCGFFTNLDSQQSGFTYNGSYWMNESRQEEYLNKYLLTGNWSKNDNSICDTSDERDVWNFVISYMVFLVYDAMGESY